eukprot:scaffold2428_cov97-Cylindrotheca_fusiformis.AAC.1
MTIVKDFSSDTTTFPDLPVHLWKEIFAFIGSSIRQQRLAMSMFGKATWSLIPELEASMKSLVISDEADANALLLHNKAVLLPPKGPRHELTVLMFEERRLPDVFRRLTNLQHLDLKSYANEGFFEFLDCHAPLPNLRSLSMVGSLGVTDQGLKRIVNGGEPRRQNFESLTITFCRNTSFAATIFIRENLPNLKLIRRQPAWLDGQFYTPFAPEGAPDEIHTYWPDGTFTFSRNTESTGFVRDLFPWDSDEDFLGDKLQYNNPLFPAGWPDWFRLAYRPGVSLLRIDEVMDSSSDTDSRPTRCVLVSQRMRGLKPPNARAVMESAKHTLLPGESKQYTEDGDVIPDDAPAD